MDTDEKENLLKEWLKTLETDMVYLKEKHSDLSSKRFSLQQNYDKRLTSLNKKIRCYDQSIKTIFDKMNDIKKELTKIESEKLKS